MRIGKFELDKLLNILGVLDKHIYNKMLPTRWKSVKLLFLALLAEMRNILQINLYTGLTSAVADESTLGFILTNMRTGETSFYSVPGAEEYSAMASAEGAVQQMKYTSTFPLLINLKGNPTYLLSLKDDAGLVKMYAFIDVND